MSVKHAACLRKPVFAQIWRYRYIYLMLLPPVVFLCVFAYYPMSGLSLAFKSFRGSFSTSTWIGWDNFERIFRDPDFFTAFKNTLLLSFMKLAVGFPIPILLAIALNELSNRRRRLSRSLQTIFTFPHFLSWVIVASIIKNLLGNDGLINSMIANFGGEKLQIFQNPEAFRWLLIFSESWKGAGWSSIIYLAALASIDPGLYESATIDGANRAQRIWCVTWPGIRGIAAMLFILAVGGLVGGNFDQVFNLYNPVVYSTGDILDTYIYRVTFGVGNTYGIATAIGLFKGIINCALLLAANFVVSKLDGRRLF